MRTITSEAVGLLAFLPPALAATLAFLATSDAERRARHAWAAIAAVYMLLSAEAQAMMRYAIGGNIRRLAIAAGIYSDRRPLQAFALLILGAAAALIIATLARNAPTRASGIARGATAAALTVFVAESVSLHAVDRVLYSFAGPTRLVCWLWLACGWTTAAAAVQCAYRRG